ncbi:MAG: GGDEF domain-containing protein, partial [Pseudomonadota bacterium]
MSLRVKMMGAFIGIVMVPTVALVVLNNTMMTDSIRESYAHKGKDTVERTVNYTLVNLVEQLRNYVAFLAVDATFTRAAYYLNDIDSDTDMKVLAKKLQQQLHISFLEVVNLTGQVTYSTLPHRNNKDILYDAAIHAAHVDGHTIIDISYDPELKEMMIHTAAKIQWQDGLIGYLHGGYILDDKFLESIAGDQTVLGVYFFGPGTLRSTHPLPLNSEEIDQTVRMLMLACVPEKRSKRPCKDYPYHVLDYAAGGSPYLVVAGLMYINSIPNGIIFASEEAKVMYADTEKSRGAIIEFGVLFASIGALLGYFVSGAIVRPINKLTNELERMADTDQLTGTRNRHSIARVFKMEISRSVRGNSSFAVMILDI